MLTRVNVAIAMLYSVVVLYHCFPCSSKTVPTFRPTQSQSYSNSGFMNSFHESRAAQPQASATPNERSASSSNTDLSCRVLCTSCDTLLKRQYLTLDTCSGKEVLSKAKVKGKETMSAEDLTFLPYFVGRMENKEAISVISKCPAGMSQLSLIMLPERCKITLVVTFLLTSQKMSTCKGFVLLATRLEEDLRIR